MIFENDYFEDEIREGFYIPGMVKRSWGAQLKVLEAIAKIAEKHNLKWFADFGTLIGAVRHEGFVPWDDDLDICMFREDYEKFKLYAPKELPRGYEYLCFESNTEYTDFLIRVTNNHSINITNDYLMDNCGFPYTAGVDIFAMDYIYADEEKEKERRETAKKVWDITETVMSGKNILPTAVLSAQIEELTGYKMNMNRSTVSELHRLMEKIFSQCDRSQGSEIAFMPKYLKNEKKKFPAGFYDEIIQIPFENTVINVPAGYEDILLRVYGKWELVRKAGGAHNYPFFKEQEEILKKSKGLVPYRYDVTLPGIEEDNKRREHESACNSSLKIITTLKQVVPHIFFAASQGDLATAGEFLESSQQLSIQLGNSLEAKYDNCSETVSLLEKYCELVFDIYNSLAESRAIDINEAKMAFENLLDSVEVSYRKLDRDSRDVLFVIAREEEWDYIKEIYDEYEADPNYTPYLMAVPFAARDNIGNAAEYADRADLFPQEVRKISFDRYPFGSRHADKIFITNPFDQYKSGMTLHSFFYASNLRQYCRELVYVHAMDIDDFTDEKSYENAKTYVLTPAVAWADRIILPSESMKEAYCRILTENASVPGEYWNEKIQVIKRPTMPSKGHKNLLFYVSVSDLIKGEERAVDWISQSLKIFEEKCEGQKVYWYIDRGTLEILYRINANSAQKLEKLISDFSGKENQIIIERNERDKIWKEIGGFYGSGGYLFNQCVRRNIPIMLRNRIMRL